MTWKKRFLVEEVNGYGVMCPAYSEKRLRVRIKGKEQPLTIHVLTTTKTALDYLDRKAPRSSHRVIELSGDGKLDLACRKHMLELISDGQTNRVASVKVIGTCPVKHAEEWTKHFVRKKRS